MKSRELLWNLFLAENLGTSLQNVLLNLRKKQYMNWERQRTYDYENGKEAGIQQKAKEAAINLLKMDKLSPEEIAQAQGLPFERVMELKEQLNHEPS